MADAAVAAIALSVICSVRLHAACCATHVRDFNHESRGRSCCNSGFGLLLGVQSLSRSTARRKQCSTLS